MKYLLGLFLAFTINSFAQNSKHILGEKYAKEELEAVLAKKPGHNIVDNKELIIKDSRTAIKMQKLFFLIFMEKKILKGKKHMKNI